MEILSDPVRSSLRICYSESDGAWNSTVSRLNTEASADSLMLLAEAISEFQGVQPADLIFTNEYQLEGV